MAKNKFQIKDIILDVNDYTKVESVVKTSGWFMKFQFIFIVYVK